MKLCALWYRVRESHKNLSWKGDTRFTEFNSCLHTGQTKNQSTCLNALSIGLLKL